MKSLNGVPEASGEARRAWVIACNQLLQINCELNCHFELELSMVEWTYDK